MNTTHRYCGALKRLPLVLLTITLLAALLGSAAAQDPDDIAVLDRSSKAFAAVVKKAGPAVVYVRVEKSLQGRSAGQNPYDFFNDPLFEHFFGPQFQPPRQAPRERKQLAAGSGFIIREDGYILTNNHVVEETNAITVTLADNREFKAEVVGTDPQTDVALLKIAARDLPIIKLGDSDKLDVGEWVIAIGSPFELNQSVTVGVVSAKGRNRMGISDYENFIQTDAAINPGNSGGPLLNIYGEAIGLNTAIFSRSGGYMGIGFAIPINMVKAIEKQLQKQGKVTRGWLGILIQDITEDLAKSFKLRETSGVLVSEITPDSPATAAGLKQGDVIAALDDQAIVDVPDLRNRIAMIPPGTRVALEIIREGEHKKIMVTIGEQPADLQAQQQQGDSTLELMGLALQDLSPELAQQFGYREEQGVLISDVAADSPAERAGLKTGYLIEEVNKHRVHNLKELKKIIENSADRKQVLLRIRIDNYSHYVVLRAE